MAVDEHRHGGGDAVSAAFFGDRRTSGIARFTAKRAPTRKDELAQAHDMGLTREGGARFDARNFLLGRSSLHRFDFSSPVLVLED